MKPKKELGQHWLYDEVSLQAMCDLAGVSAEDTVLEIGPGLGTLTKKLVTQARQVIAVEFDNALASGLDKEVPADNLTVVHSDILRFNLTELPADYKVIANIPYYLTSNLVRVLSETSNPPASVTLLIQKEVAERIAAAPGDMSLLSVTAQLYFEPSLGPVVPAALFTPPPKIDSQIIHLARRPKPLLEEQEMRSFIRTVKAGFGNRRKTLLNSLSAGLRLSKDETTALLHEAGINPQQRPQSLSIDDWLRLSRRVASSSS